MRGWVGFQKGKFKWEVVIISKLNLVEFLSNNKDCYREILEEEPYNLKVRENEGLVLFGYGYEADFSLDIVRESRGVILEKNTWDIVCYPFKKFFNYGEPLAADIDWNTAEVYEKLDGSMIKVYNYKNDWFVGTMNTIDARNAPIINQKDCPFDNFYELFMRAKDNSGLEFDSLDENCTYLFELVSPYNKIVIDYDDTEIYHLSTRDNESLEEIDQDIGVQKPKTYNFSSIDNVLESAEDLPASREGYVVVDGNYNRVKIKSPKYVALHNMVSGEISDRRILEMIMDGEDGEFLNYFPEYKERVKDIKEKYEKLLGIVEDDLKVADKRIDSADSRKEYALWAKERVMPSLLFSYLDGEVDKDSFVDYIRDINSKKLVEKLKEV